LAALEASQWIFISSPRAWATIPRWPEKYPVMNRYYQTLFDGNLGFELKKEFAVYPHLGSWTFPDGGAEEALTVYDHPRVLLFRKGPNWSFQKAKELLEAIPLPENKNTWQPRLAPTPDEARLPRPPG
jgi:hypothetical protein